MKNRKLAFFVLIICCFSICLGALCGCTNADKRSNANQLSIVNNLDYNIAEVASNFAKPKDICLAKNGDTEYGIVISANASKWLREQANIFVGYLNKIVGKDSFKVFGDDKKYKDKIMFFKTEGNGLIVDDGYSIATVNQNINFVALTEFGLVNAMYDFLEKYLECMFVRADFDYIPQLPTIYLDNINVVCNPSFASRSFSSVSNVDMSRINKLKLNAMLLNDTVQTTLKDKSSNCFSIVDPKVYFQNHPEYFALRDNKRIATIKGHNTQLCLTNDDVFAVVRDAFKVKIEQNPKQVHWTFSINDNDYCCQCDKCVNAYERGGSNMATTINFVNKLAKEFSNKIITTEVFNEGQIAPLGVVACSNVNIALSLKNCSQKYNFVNGKAKQAVVAKTAILDWGKVSQNVTIFEDIVNVENLLLPFPNIGSHKEDLKFFQGNNVTGVYFNGGVEESAELGSLRSYVLSRQLWDSNIDVNKIIAKYVAVAYGNAQVEVAKYLDLQSKLLFSNNNDLDVCENITEHKYDYLSNSAVKEYAELIDIALIAESDPAIKSRLEEIKISVLYAQVNLKSY
ncbi:MAG: DUF4838 domain-containing protein, partial [Clostridia bacterium]